MKVFLLLALALLCACSRGPEEAALKAQVQQQV